MNALGDGSDELFFLTWRRIAAVTGERLLRLSVAFQRGNAASVLGTVGGESRESNVITITNNYKWHQDSSHVTQSPKPWPR